MKPKVLITRDVFDEVRAYLLHHFDVIGNPEDVQYDAATLAAKLANCDGVMTAISDRVDADALEEALRSRRILAAGLDVCENEPALHRGFLALDNVVLAPHIASSTRATRLAMAMTAAHNLVAALTGDTPPNLVNPAVKRQ